MNEQLTRLLALEHQRDLLREAARACCTRLVPTRAQQLWARAGRRSLAPRACCA